MQLLNQKNKGLWTRDRFLAVFVSDQIIENQGIRLLIGYDPTKSIIKLFNVKRQQFRPFLKDVYILSLFFIDSKVVIPVFLYI